MLLVLAAATLLALSSAETHAAAGPLTVTPITWNVVGLANNNGDVSSGPFEYPAGVRVCNTGADPATNVNASWTWSGGIDSNLWQSPTDNTSKPIGTLAGNSCQDVYFDVQVKKVQSNRGKTQDRTVTATADGGLSGSNTQTYYVESLVKQNRNSTEKLAGPGGCNLTYTVCDPAVTNLYVGQTYTYKFYAQTATAYDELDAFALFPSFTSVRSTSTTYSTVSSPGPSSVSRIWSDACTWTGVTSSSSGTCTTAGKSGGRVVTTYTVRADSVGSGSVPDLIYDHSGSSFHYNADWSSSAPLLTSTFNVYWKLAATVVGNGTVTSNVAGNLQPSGTGTINCGAGGTVCNAGYANNTSVTLTATPGSGQTFTGWSGDGSCTGASTTCTVTMNQSRSVTATFTGITQYPLYVTKYGSGTVTANSGSVNCGATCNGTYASGTNVTLTESPAAGWKFDGWSGDCASSGTSPTCSVTMSQERDVTATFEQLTYTLTVNATGTGAGDLCSNNSNQSNAGACSPSTEPIFISCGSSSSTANYTDTTCTGTYPSGTSATLYPMCNGGSSGTPCPGGSGASTVSFGGYTGGTCTGNATTGCAFTMDQDRTVNANFILGSSAVPDLTISKSHSGNFSQGDTGKTYTLTVTNVGTGASYTGKTITVTDNPPSGLTVTGMSGTGWSCTVVTKTCTQTLASNLAAGASLNPITVTVSVASNASTPLVNAATVTCSSSCTNDTSNDTASDPTTILTPPDLTLVKSHTDTFTEGSTATWVLTASNSGGQPTSGTVTVTDTLPSGFTKSSISATGWSCGTSTSTVITCTRSDALAAGSSYDAINVTVNIASNAVTSTNTGSVSGGGETNTSNDSSSDPTTVESPLNITTAGNGTGTVTSDVGAISCNANAGTCAATYDSGTVVTLTESPDTGSTFTGWSGDIGSCVASATTCQVTMNQVRNITATFTLQTFQLTVTTSGSGTGTVSSDVGGISCNSNAGTCSHTYNYGATVTLSEAADGGSTFSGWSGGCVVTGATCVATMTQARTVDGQFDSGTAPDLTIAKSHTGDFRQGDTGDTYSVTVHNSGTAATSGTVTVTETPPTGETVTAMTGTNWSCATSAPWTCSRSDSLGASASYEPITVTVSVASDADALLTNTATVAGGGETNTSNDTATDDTTVVQNPVLSIAKVYNPTGQWRQGDTGVASDYYTLTVSNGSATTVGPTSGTVTVTDTAPTGLTITAMSGTGWTCTTLPVCTRTDPLARGTSYDPIAVSVDVAADAPATVTNHASVSGGGCTSSPCDTTSDDTPITARYQLTVATTGSGSGGVVSDLGSIACGSAGSTCQDTYDSGTVVTLTETPDPGSTFMGWSGDCSGFTQTCQVTMSQAQSVTAEFDVADLTVSKSHTDTFRQGDTGDTYSVTVHNSGNGPTDGSEVSLTESPPTGETITGMSGTNWTCPSSAPWVCTRSDILGAGDSYEPITVTVSVGSNAPTPQVNSVTVAGGGETDTSNDTATDSTDIVENPVLSITKVHNPSGHWRQGDTGNASDYYTLTVSNSSAATVGPTAGTVTVNDTAPIGLTITSMSGDGWTCTTIPTCTRSDALDPGDTYPVIKVYVDVASDAASTVTNNVTVDGGGCAADPCDTTSDDTPITQNPELSITKTHNAGGSWRQGDTGDVSDYYTLTVTNSSASTAGPTDGSTVTVTDAAPAGLTITAMSGDGWTCTTLPTCSRSDALDPGDSYPVIKVYVDVSASSPLLVTNHASVDGGGCADSPCDTASDDTQITGRYQLTVATHGNGSGNVTTDVGAINCGSGGSDCNDTYDGGTAVTLTAAPDTGSDFTGWSGDIGSCTPTALTCHVDMDRARGITATFTLQKRTLSVAASGNGVGTIKTDVGGIACATGQIGTCSHSYNYGALVTLTATAHLHSTFMGWSGDIGSCVPTAAVCQVTMDQSRSVVADFGIADLTVSKTHAGSFRQGDVGDTYTVTVHNSGDGPTDGSLVRVTESPPTGLTITAMSGSGWTCVTSAPWKCTRSDVLDAGSSYEPITVTVSVNAHAATPLTNSVTVSGGGESNTSNDTGTDPTPILQNAILSIVKTHTGTFKQGDTGDAYSITVSNAAGATVGATVGTVTVTETPPAGETITAMSGSGWTCATSAPWTCTRTDPLTAGHSYPHITVTVHVAADAPTSVTNHASVDDDACTTSPCASTIDPTPIVPRYELTAATTGNGSGTVTSNVGAIDCGSGGSTCDDMYDNGTVVTLTATADTDSTFMGWSGDCSGSTTTCQVTMDQARAVTADFGRADLAISKSHTDTFHQGDAGLHYEISVENTGDGPTTETVTVTEAPPSEETVTAMSGTGWNCSIGTLTCSRSDALAAGDSYPDITVTVSVASDAGPSATNSASVDGGGCDTSPCDTSDDPTTILPGATLAGTVYNDRTGHPGLAGWTVYLDLNHNGSPDSDEPSTTTDANGDYSMSGLGGGTYLVREVTQDGWTCSTPSPCANTPTVAPGGSSTGNDFGNVKADATVSIAGTLYNDLNADGTRQSGEPGLEGWTVWLDTDGNGTLDASDIQTQTGADGSYSFSHIEPGAYTLYESTPDGWKCSQPEPCSYSKTFVAGDSVTGLDFGNWAHALLTGHQWEDANRDGIHQDSEAPLGGWTIYVDYNDNGRLDPGEPSSVTLPNGYYGITDIAAGTWTVRELAEPDWTCSGPSGCAYSLTFDPLSEIRDKDFLDWAPARVTGELWDDLEGDTFLDPGEPGLPGWVVYVDYNGDGSLDSGDISTETNAGGNFSMGVKPGTWTVREQLPPLWICDSPSPCGQTFTFASGDTKNGDFGNYRLATLAGTMFDDLNKDGKQQAEDPGLGGWKIYVDYNDNGQWDPGEPFDLTSGGTGLHPTRRSTASTRGKPGHYEITGIDPGTWTIREIRQSGFPCTLPFSCAYRQTFLDNSRIDHRDFATYKPLLAGAATLSAPGACVAGDFTAQVKGRQIRRAVVTAGRAYHHVFTGRPGTHQHFTIRLDATAFTVGGHRLTATVLFTTASGTKPKHLAHVFFRCGKPKPPFTG